MAQTTNKSGGCLCGAVRYEVRGPMRPVVYCHCEQCRKTSGNFVAATACEPEHLLMLADEALRWYASSEKAQRGFCGDCGSNLFWRPNHSEYVSILAGTIDLPTGLKAISHIFVGNASDYVVIDDGLEQYEEQGPTGMIVES